MADDGEQDVISGGQLVTPALKTEGIDVIFTLCVDHIIDVVDVRHEQVAAHAADGYARITERPGRAVVKVAFEKRGGDIVTCSGQTAKYGEERVRIGNAHGDVPCDQFATMPGGYGEEVRDPADIRPALERARNSGQPSLINVWVDPEVYAPGTMNQTMYK